MDTKGLQQETTVVFSHTPRSNQALSLGHRRTLARMIRVELEITMGLLNKALECERAYGCMVCDALPT